MKGKFFILLTLSICCLYFACSKNDIGEKHLTDLIISKNPEKTSYQFNESISYRGIEVKLLYNDGSSTLLDYDECIENNITFRPNEGELITNSTMATISYVNNTNVGGSFRISMIVIDNEQNEYPVKKIGEQYWMASNLRTQTYNNGDLILTPSPAMKDISDEINPKYQWVYNNDEMNNEIHGRLYTWAVISDERGICPDGWHVPTDEEWWQLINHLGGYDIAGGCLKSTDYLYWDEPNVGANNSSGFSALASGVKRNDSFYNMGRTVYFWTSTEKNQESAYYHYLGWDFDGIYGTSDFKTFGYSIRLIKD